MRFWVWREQKLLPNSRKVFVGAGGKPSGANGDVNLFERATASGPPTIENLDFFLQLWHLYSHITLDTRLFPHAKQPNISHISFITPVMYDPDRTVSALLCSCDLGWFLLCVGCSLIELLPEPKPIRYWFAVAYTSCLNSPFSSRWLCYRFLRWLIMFLLMISII